jgi:hypothetical protein
MGDGPDGTELCMFTCWQHCIADVWVIDWVLHTMVTEKHYGLLHIMGYESYGLGGRRL